jgi:hypothetical protein
MPRNTSVSTTPVCGVGVDRPIEEPVALGESAMLCRLLQIDEDRRGGCAVVDRVAGEDSEKIEPLALRDGEVLHGVDRVPVVRQVAPAESEN